ncbi:hypothetical protein RND71_014321 [Anisodus tanguticus]|uniref:CASP-like protein n=1 Tax=Anisodus tanguticus TaxID=243964 RepID=A0AAE1SCL8_9SOLA|nr:hypothetical protein RND71_014321 [Anisodus tanguticus]
MGKSVIMVLRLVAFVCLVGSLIILLTSSQYSLNEHLTSSLKLNLLIFMFMLVVIAVICWFALPITSFKIQTVLSLSIGVSLLDVFGDMIIANILVSGAAATYGFTLELSRAADLEPTSFFNKIFVSAGLSLLAALFTLISLLSSHVALKGPAN